MTSAFLVVSTSRFDRELRKLVAEHSTLPVLLGRVIDILKTDPFKDAAPSPSARDTLN